VIHTVLVVMFIIPDRKIFLLYVRDIKLPCGILTQCWVSSCVLTMHRLNYVYFQNILQQNCLLSANSCDGPVTVSVWWAIISCNTIHVWHLILSSITLSFSVHSYFDNVMCPVSNVFATSRQWVCAYGFSKGQE
jgi:hypothetical protein